MPDMVKAEDKMDSAMIIKAYKDLLSCENRIQDPIDDIQMIFQKITAWKKSRAPGGLDAQEKYVTKSMK